MSHPIQWFESLTKDWTYSPHEAVPAMKGDLVVARSLGVGGTDVVGVFLSAVRLNPRSTNNWSSRSSLGWLLLTASGPIVTRDDVCTVDVIQPIYGCVG